MISPFRLRALALAGAPLFGALVACGPSFQAISEGNARFEHCYALEENPQTSMPDKALCWRDWSEHYTYGQTRDRIHYATARYVALSQAPSLPTDEAMMRAAPGETPRASTITAPAPTNAFAPPPKVLEPGEPRVVKAPSDIVTIPVVDAGPPAPPPPSLPSASCADGCGDTYRGCSGGCDGASSGASSKQARSCEACLKTYRACMRGCFK
ncbi:MAG: hypothetical protein K0S65_263 [Labilithrix sp.]|nr:hypothetical protein [Labilithrix sp.]